MPLSSSIHQPNAPIPTPAFFFSFFGSFCPANTTLQKASRRSSPAAATHPHFARTHHPRISDTRLDMDQTWASLFSPSFGFPRFLHTTSLISILSRFPAQPSFASPGSGGVLYMYSRWYVGRTCGALCCILVRLLIKPDCLS